MTPAFTLSQKTSEEIDWLGGIGRNQVNPGRHRANPNIAKSSSLRASLLIGSHYELVEAKDGSLGSVASDDLNHDTFTDLPLSVLLYNFLPHSPPPPSPQAADHNSLASSAEPPSNSFEEPDGVQTSDSLSTLRLSYTFPDPTDNELPAESSPTESTGHRNTPSHLSDDPIEIASTAGPAERTHGQQQLHLYLLGSPLSRSGERTLLDKLRANLVDQTTVRKHQETSQCRARVSEVLHPAIAQALSSPTYVPQQAARPRQTTGRLVDIILHDFTHLSEPLVRLRLE